MGLIIDVDNAASLREKEKRFHAEMDRDDCTVRFSPPLTIGSK